MFLQRLKMLLAPPAWRFLQTTVPLRAYEPLRELEGGPVIFACLHRDILPSIMFVRSVRPALMVSHSPDGDILVRTLGERDYRFARGATESGGLRALLLLRRELEAGHSVGVAVDGPEGPFGAIREGVLHLARMTGAPIAPLVAHAPGALVMNTWDRTVVPVPFRRVEMEMGPILRISPQAEAEEMILNHDRLAEFFGVQEAQ
jgi:lysophospholipid acyltransferase (LPLAT)-like uncharacterized protein